MRAIEAGKISEVIAQIQKESGLNVKEFGEAHGLTRPAMSNIIHGKHAPSKELLASYGILPAYFIPAKLKRK